MEVGGLAAGRASVAITFGEAQEVFEIGRLLEALSCSGAECGVEQVEPVGVVEDQPGGSFGDCVAQRIDDRLFVVVRVDRLAGVVEEGRGQELFVVGELFAGQGVDLERVSADQSGDVPLCG